MKKYRQNQDDEIMPLEFITDVRSGWLFDYPLYPQEVYYWCGPASIKQAIQYITGASASQSVYAANMGTNGDVGTYVYLMTNELNRNQSVHSYAHEYMYNWDTVGIWNRIVANAEANLPSIMHTLTKYLYLYNGANFGHYITALGYMRNEDGTKKSIVYMDTYSYDGGRGTTLGEHTDSIENIANSLGGRYLIW